MKNFSFFNKSIFAKLLGINYIIVLLSFIILGVLLFGLLGEYLISKEEKTLRVAGQHINELTVSLLRSNTAGFIVAYSANLEFWGQSTQSFIFVFDQSGKVFATSEKSMVLDVEKIDKSQFELILKGEDIKKTGTLQGVFSQTVLTIGLPLRYGDEIIGGVLLNSPIPQIHQARLDLFRLFMIAVLVSIIIAAILTFALSNKISQPLKAINRAAATIASGQFQNRVEVTSQDEVGQLAQTFNFMAESLENLENMRSSFVANVSHELRTPMTTITGFIEGILDGTISHEKQPMYLSIVLDETKRLSRLVTNLLDVARIDKDRKEMRVDTFDLNEMIRSSIIKFESAIVKKNIQVEALFEQQRCTVKADRDCIQRVVINLLDNAVKFCNVHGKITAQTKVMGGKVCASIKNTGTGIKQEDLKYIWDRFYKTDKSRSDDKMGAGLGLFIVKNIIQNHEQEIWAESKYEEDGRMEGYAKFTFTVAVDS